MISFESHSPQQTQEFAERIGKALAPNTCIAFFGGLGAGKTTFTHGLAKGLGLPDVVSSPTFALVNEYHGDGCPSLYHFDMYRVTSPEALETTGFWDYPQEDSVFVIEWAENIVECLPECRIEIRIDGMGDAPRSITVTGEELLHDFSC